MIYSVEQLAALSNMNQSRQTDASRDDGGIFADIFRSAIDNVKQTEAEVVETEYLMATGQLDNPATLMIAETKAATAVDLLVQLRNKALDAYSELTRINL